MPGRGTRSVTVISLIGVFLVLLFLTTLRSSESIEYATPKRPGKAKALKDLDIQDADLKGHTIMPKLGNETAKAELGRAAWRVLHTTMARFPDEPTIEESAALKSYLHLFQRLYPCGECSQHFRKIIDKYPPQVSSRSTAAAWACHVHNEVNKSLKKDIFDCSKIGDFYDCGCADDEEDDTKGGKAKAKGTKAKAAKASSLVEEDPEAETGLAEYEKPEMSRERLEKITGDEGREFDPDTLKLPKLKQEG